VITDHRYDSGPYNTHGPCIALDAQMDPCLSSESSHVLSEYELTDVELDEIEYNQRKGKV